LITKPSATGIFHSNPNRITLGPKKEGPGMFFPASVNPRAR
jgi:hypothetical protein